MVSPSHNPEHGQTSEENLPNEEVMRQDALALSFKTQEGVPPVSSIHTDDQSSRGSLDNKQVRSCLITA